MTDIERLMRPNIRQLIPYRSARHDFSSGTLLDANENAFGSPISYRDLALHRYPDPFQRELRSALAQLHQVEPECVAAGVGSDELIDLLLRIFCVPGSDAVIINEPTYGMYTVAARTNDVSVRTVSLTKEFRLDLNALTALTDPSVKIIFCCSPNNPTGNLLGSEDILQLCRQTSAIVVVDEAYIEYAQAPSLVTEAGHVANLVVLRTLSKAWGLAAVRLGFMVAHPLIVSTMLKVKAPYSINLLTSTEVLKALKQKKQVEENILRTITERNRLHDALQSLPAVVQVYPSDANFLLVKFRRARVMFNALSAQGIIVRDRCTVPGLEECLRISIGMPDENTAVINTLREAA